MAVTPERVKQVLEQLRDEMTRQPNIALIYPMACDVLVSNPHLIRHIATLLCEPSK